MFFAPTETKLTFHVVAPGEDSAIRVQGQHVVAAGRYLDDWGQCIRGILRHCFRKVNFAHLRAEHGDVLIRIGIWLRNQILMMCAPKAGCLATPWEQFAICCQQKCIKLSESDLADKVFGRFCLKLMQRIVPLTDEFHLAELFFTVDDSITAPLASLSLQALLAVLFGHFVVLMISLVGRWRHLC